MDKYKGMSLRERKKAECREAILLAARDTFEEKGFHDTTMREIADKAVISPASLFNYFHSKIDILKNVELLVQGDFELLLESEEFKAMDDVCRIKRIFREYVSSMEPVPRLVSEISQMHTFGPFEFGGDPTITNTIMEYVDKVADSKDDRDFIINSVYGIAYTTVTRGTSVEQCCEYFNRTLDMILEK